MARSRSAASLSLTIGIAVATLVVATGILAGPAVRDCSARPSSFGACLRGKVVESGLLPSEPAPVASEAPATRAPGWIEANATEYELPTTSAAAALSAEPGSLEAAGSLPGTEVRGDIALADPGASLLAEGFAPIPQESADAVLAPIITGSIDASAGGGFPGGVAGRADIAPPVLPAAPDASGRVGLATRGEGRASLAPQLIADLSPVPPLAEIVPPPVPKAPPPIMPRPLAVPKATAQVDPKPIARPRPPQYDPRYPNVLVLPPPNTGENSSFATLELR